MAPPTTLPERGIALLQFAAAGGGRAHWAIWLSLPHSTFHHDRTDLRASAHGKLLDVQAVVSPDSTFTWEPFVRSPWTIKIGLSLLPRPTVVWIWTGSSDQYDQHVHDRESSLDLEAVDDFYLDPFERALRPSLSQSRLGQVDPIPKRDTIGKAIMRLDHDPDCQTIIRRYLLELCRSTVPFVAEIGALGLERVPRDQWSPLSAAEVHALHLEPRFDAAWSDHQRRRAANDLAMARLVAQCGAALAARRHRPAKPIGTALPR